MNVSYLDKRTLPCFLYALSVLYVILRAVEMLITIFIFILNRVQSVHILLYYISQSDNRTARYGYNKKTINM